MPVLRDRLGNSLCQQKPYCAGAEKNSPCRNGSNPDIQETGSEVIYHRADWTPSLPIAAEGLPRHVAIGSRGNGVPGDIGYHRLRIHIHHLRGYRVNGMLCSLSLRHATPSNQPNNGRQTQGKDFLPFAAWSDAEERRDKSPIEIKTDEARDEFMLM